MIVAVSGLAGCGKNSVGDEVARLLKLRTVQISFKDEAARRGVTLMELQAMAAKDKRFDVKLDAQIVKEANKGDCVVMTWLAPWMVRKADLRVWLKAPLEERARRVAKRDGMKPDEALAHVRKRDADNRKRYKRFYGIDIAEHSVFDLEVDTKRFKPAESAAIIAAAARAVGTGKKTRRK